MLEPQRPSVTTKKRPRSPIGEEDAQILEKFRGISVWKRAEERAPHKPLLLLLALAKLVNGETKLAFVDCEAKIVELLREFGPTRASYHPEYPFWRLQSDGVWEVQADRPMRSRASNSDPPRTELRAVRAVGSFPEGLRKRLLARPHLIRDAAAMLLNAHFPTSLHTDILDAVDMVDICDTEPASRDPRFRDAVLTAYGFRCAVCGFDVRIRNLTVALEAAHIKWHQAQGPNVVDNSLALCSLHHKLFDYGAFTIDTRERRVLVSEQVHGSVSLDEALLRYHGEELRSPIREDHRPRPDYIAWHQEWVFKKEARPRR